jgi:hypothetical protein
MLLALLCAVAGPAHAEEGSVSAAALKAAFLYNFGKLVDWPSNAMGADGPLVICTNDVAVADSLQQLLKAHESGGRGIDVRRVSVDSVQVRGCHVLYVRDLNAVRAVQLVDTLSGAAVLTVSDFGRFAGLGGVVQFVEDGGRLRFAVNIDSMRRHRLQLSSRLLALASIVKDEPSVH